MVNFFSHTGNQITEFYIEVKINKLKLYAPIWVNLKNIAVKSEKTSWHDAIFVAPRETRERRKPSANKLVELSGQSDFELRYKVNDMHQKSPPSAHEMPFHSVHSPAKWKHNGPNRQGSLDKNRGKIPDFLASTLLQRYMIRLRGLGISLRTNELNKDPRYRLLYCGQIMFYKDPRNICGG